MMHKRLIRHQEEHLSNPLYLLLDTFVILSSIMRIACPAPPVFVV